LNWDYDKMHRELVNNNDYKNKMQIIKEVIDQWDPIGLLSFCPQDEYEMEIGSITAYAAKEIDINTLAIEIQTSNPHYTAL
jgi:hypothetical protein